MIIARKNIVLPPLIVFLILNVILTGSAFALAASDLINVSQQVVDEGQVEEDDENFGHIIPFDKDSPWIENISIIEITDSSVAIIFKTSEPAIGRVYYGLTKEYTAGSLVGVTYAIEHGISIIDLEPDTVYHFKIEAQDSSGNLSKTDDWQFKTLLPPDKIAPPNVSNLRTRVIDDQIELFWDNPVDDDFAGIKLMRSDQFYPQDPYDGENILKGDYQEYVNKNVEQGKMQYYTVFTYDEHNNYSSGAIVSAIISGPGKEPEGAEEEFPGEIEDEDRPREDIMLEDFGLTLDDIIFTMNMNGVRVMPVDGQLDLYPEIPLNITISYDKLPVVLKTIVFTLKSGSKSFSFLLRVNESKDFFEATISLPEEAGSYPFTISFLGYQKQRSQNLNGTILIKRDFIQAGKGRLSSKPGAALMVIKKFNIRWDRVLMTLTGLLLLILIYLFYRLIRRKIQRARMYY